MAAQRLTEGQRIGRQGEAEVIARLTSFGFLCVSTGSADFGEDIICDIFQGGIRTNLSFRMQVKSSKGITSTTQIKQRNGGVSVKVSASLFDEWCCANHPVVLVCWDVMTSSGYWCFPVDSAHVRQAKTRKATITVSCLNKLNEEARYRIVSGVEKFFANRMNINSCKYECNIYPVLMPYYRLALSAPDWRSFVDTDVVEYEQSEFVPSFLASYASLDTSPFTSKIVFSRSALSIDHFISELKAYILSVAKKIEMSCEKWISFVISPVSLVNDHMYLRNNDFHMTEWVSFSFLHDMIFSDWEYTFDLGEKFIPTRKDRAYSADEDFFVNACGRFAVEIKAFTKNNIVYFNSARMQKSIRKKHFLLWDIENLGEDQFFELEIWARENGLVVQKINSEKSIDAIIRHPMFNYGAYGFMAPLPMSWRDYDESDISKLASTIPHGRPLNSIRANEYKDLFEDSGDLDGTLFINYESAMYGLPFVHSMRIINVVVCFESRIDERDLFFKEKVNALKKKLNKLSHSVCFFTTRGVPDDFLYAVFECRPMLECTSKCFCDILEVDIDAFSKSINEHYKTTVDTYEYIRYHCGRFFDLNRIVKTHGVNKM